MRGIEHAPEPAQLKVLNGVVAALAKDQEKLLSYEDKNGHFFMPASIESVLLFEDEDGEERIVDVRHRFVGKIARMGVYRSWSLWSLRLFEDYYAVHDHVGYKQHNVYSFEWTHDKTLLAVKNIRVAQEAVSTVGHVGEIELGDKQVLSLEDLSGTWSDLYEEVHDEPGIHHAQYQLLKVTAADCEQLITDITAFRATSRATVG